MESGRTPRKGVRGWSVSQGAGLRRATGPAGPSFLETLGARRGLLVRVGVLSLALWAGGALVLGDKGVLRLHALREQALAMSSQNQAIEQQLKDTNFELQEDAGLNMERVMRERYGKSLPNEVVYRKVVVAADSMAAAADTLASKLGR
jgi:cell division protein FtsB